MKKTQTKVYDTKKAQTKVYATDRCHPEYSAVYHLFRLRQDVSMDEGSQTKVYDTKKGTD